jgi:membrane-bound serine protease (ClpP class)
VALAAALYAAACGVEDTPGAVHILTADTAVNRPLERYIDRGIGHAEQTGARAVVIHVDTPGGEIGTMKRIAGRIESATVPVITYVSPAGAQAASAGTFITMAGHIAAMAPNTTIGAATPIDVTGQDIEGALGRKVTNDTAAFARGVAELHGRNAEWAEAAVREAVSASESEALELNVVDFVEPNLASLLATVEGTEVTLLDGRSVTLALSNAPRIENDRNLYERVLNVLSNPLIVSVLMLIGIGGLSIEFFAPGTFVPGTAGVLALLTAFLGLGALLPAEAAVAFLIVGVLLGVLEAFVPSGGVLGAGAAVAIVLGLFIVLGQLSTELNVARIAAILGIITAAIVVLGGTALIILARNYLAGTERSGRGLY